MKSTAIKFLFVIGVTTLAWFSVSAAVIAISATLLAILHGKASSIIELSFGPLKAKIERELSDAENLVQKLKALAIIQARQSIAASAATGRLASGNDWVFVATKRTESALKEVGITDEELKLARTDLIDLTLSDLGYSALGGAMLPLNLSREAQEQWKAVRVRPTISNPDAVQKWLTDWHLLTPDRQKRIEDMRWIMEHQDIRDSEQYMRAHTPIEWD